jgi:hypothetical protein
MVRKALFEPDQNARIWGSIDDAREAGEGKVAGSRRQQTVPVGAVRAVFFFSSASRLSYPFSP